MKKQKVNLTNLFLVAIMFSLYACKNLLISKNSVLTKILINNQLNTSLAQIFILFLFLLIITNTIYRFNLYSFNKIEFFIVTIFYIYTFLFQNYLTGIISNFSYWDDGSKYTDLLLSLDEFILIPFDLYEYPSLLHLIGLASTVFNKLFIGEFYLDANNYIVLTRTILNLIASLSFFVYFAILKKVLKNPFLIYLAFFTFIFNFELLSTFRFIGADSVLVLFILLIVYLLIDNKYRFLPFFILGLATSAKYTPIIFFPIVFFYTNNFKIFPLISKSINTYIKQFLCFFTGFALISPGVFIKFDKFILDFKRASEEYKSFHPFLSAPSPYGVENKTELFIKICKYIFENLLVINVNFIFVLLVISIGFLNKEKLKFNTLLMSFILMAVLTSLLGNTLIVRNFIALIPLGMLLLFQVLDQLISKLKLANYLVITLLVVTISISLFENYKILSYSITNNIERACSYLVKNNIYEVSSSRTIKNSSETLASGECKKISFIEDNTSDNYLLFYWDLIEDNAELDYWPSNENYFIYFMKPLVNFNYYPTWPDGNIVLLLDNKSLYETGVYRLNSN
jgi:hypothetical protein